VSDAVDALQRGDRQRAVDHVMAIDRQALWGFWFEASVQWRNRHTKHDGAAGRAGSLPTARQLEVATRDSWRFTPDHVLPGRFEGRNDVSNLVAACGACQYNKRMVLTDRIGAQQSVRP
jgi:hypothetical protein